MIYIVPTDTCFWIACSLYSSNDYKKIYELKKRSYDKPLAVMVENLDYLEKNTHISPEQKNFLLNYKRPYTILLQTKTDFIPSDIPNKLRYKKVAFRVAHLDVQKKLLDMIGPFFLTSANLSDTKEIYELVKIPFEESDELKILGDDDIEITPPSDIFEFIGDTTQIVYLRKY